MQRMRLGEMLVTMNAITQTQLNTALAYQGRSGCRLGRALSAMNLVEEGSVFRTLARQLRIPYVDLEGRTIAPEILVKLPTAAMRKFQVLPVALKHGNPRGPLLVATSEPQDLRLIDELTFAAGLPVEPLLAAPKELAAALAVHGICGPRVIDPLELSDGEDGGEFVILRGGLQAI